MPGTGLVASFRVFSSENTPKNELSLFPKFLVPLYHQQACEIKKKGFCEALSNSLRDKQEFNSSNFREISPLKDEEQN